MPSALRRPLIMQYGSRALAEALAMAQVEPSGSFVTDIAINWRRRIRYMWP
jgi:hypothetical protein